MGIENGVSFTLSEVPQQQPGLRFGVQRASWDGFEQSE